MIASGPLAFPRRRHNAGIRPDHFDYGSAGVAGRHGCRRRHPRAQRGRGAERCQAAGGGFQQGHRSQDRVHRRLSRGCGAEAQGRRDLRRGDRLGTGDGSARQGGYRQSGKPSAAGHYRHRRRGARGRAGAEPRHPRRVQAGAAGGEVGGLRRSDPAQPERRKGGTDPGQGGNSRRDEAEAADRSRASGEPGPDRQGRGGDGPL